MVKGRQRKFGIETRGGRGKARVPFACGFLEGCWFLLLFFCLVVGDGGGAGVSGGFWCCCCPLFVAVLWRMFLVLAGFSGRSFLVDCSVLCVCKLILFLLTTR